MKDLLIGMLLGTGHLLQNSVETLKKCEVMSTLQHA